MSDPKSRKTLVEEGTQFKGSLSSDCPIEVKGRIEGELSAPALAVSPSGAVHGKIKVGEIRSQGELAGEFEADVVQLSGTVRDNTVIRAKSLEVKLSPPGGKMQVIFGDCELEVGAEQAEKATGTQATERARSQSARPAAEAPSAQAEESPTAEANSAE
jgi:cytoskeletal protein CcmA (bactofilin family)